MSDTQQLDDLKNELDKINYCLPTDQRPSVVFNKNKLSTLIGLQDEQISYRLNRNEYSIRFNDPIFIRSILFTISSAPVNTERKLSIKHVNLISGKKEEIEGYKQNENEYLYQLGAVTKEIIIKANYNWADQKIVLSKINISGYSQTYLDILNNRIDKVIDIKSNFDNHYSETISEIDDEKSKLAHIEDEHDVRLEELTNNINSKHNEISEAEQELDDIRKEITTEQNNHITIQTKNTNIQSQVNDKENKLSRVLDQIKERNIENINLIEKTQKIKSELDEARRDKSLFSDEIVEFARQGANNARIYTWLSLVPLLLISIIAIKLFYSAEDMISQINLLEKLSPLDIIISKIPFALVSIALIQTCYYICKSFITKIMEIHQDRLALSRIAIIAKDVSDASFSGLAIKDEIKYEVRTKLKMDMLKAHMAKDLGEEYSYEAEKYLSKASIPLYQKAMNAVKELFEKKKTTKISEE